MTLYRAVSLAVLLLASVGRGTAQSAEPGGPAVFGTIAHTVHLAPICHHGVNNFQCPSETTSTAPSTTLTAV
jgi:hypothetical protein